MSNAGEERAFIRLKNNATGPTSSVSIALQAFDDKGISFAYTSRDYAYNDLSDFGVCYHQWAWNCAGP